MADTFRLSAVPRIGSLILVTSAEAQAAESPEASLPSTIARGAPKVGFGVQPRGVDRRGEEMTHQARSQAIVSAGVASQTCCVNSVPMLARMQFGL